jgi:hypothetical protein
MMLGTGIAFAGVLAAALGLVAAEPGRYFVTARVSDAGPLPSKWS